MRKLVCPSCGWTPPEYEPLPDHPGMSQRVTREARLLEYIAHLLETKHNAFDGPQAAHR